MRYSLLTPRHLLRPLHLHLKSRGQTLLLGRHVLLQANHLEEEEEGEEGEEGPLGRSEDEGGMGSRGGAGRKVRRGRWRADGFAGPGRRWRWR